MAKTNKRDVLTQQADLLREKYNFTGEPLSIFMQTAGKHFAEANAEITEDSTPEEIVAALEPAKKALDSANLWIKLDRVDYLAGVGGDKAMALYLADQTVDGYVVGSDEGIYSAQEAKIEVNPADVVKAVRHTEWPGIKDRLAIFADNCTLFVCGKEPAHNRPTMTEDYIAMRKRIGWDNTPSKRELARQLTVLVKAIFGEAVTVDMINPDVTYVVESIVATKNTANSAGKFVQKKESTILKAVVRAAYTRQNSLPYDWQVESRQASKAPLSEKRNKPMAEQKKKATKPAKVTKQKVEVAPEEKAEEKAEEK